MVFNLVKDLFKQTEGLGRSVTGQVQFESGRFIDLDNVRKKYSIIFHFSPSKLAI